MSAISMKNIVKEYGDGTKAVNDVSIEVLDGELLVLVGPSGCGKSTALRLIAGLDTPDGGKILIDDRDVSRVPPQDRDVAMVFQGYALYPHLRVRDNIAFPLKMRGVPAAERAQRVDEAAAMLGLGKLLDRRPGELSGGERQRVAMGRAIVRDPRVFLFDEPLSNLDAALRAELRVELARPGAPPRRDLALRDPRPDRGHDHGRSDRPAPRRRAPAGGPAPRHLRRSGQRSSSPASWAHRR